MDDTALTALLREHPHFAEPPRSVRGRNLTFRSATPNDAEFILPLRLAKGEHLSPTPPDVEAQRDFLRRPRDGFYFIIEADGRPVGTVRLYDQRGTSFSWGSWILSDDAPHGAAVESTFMVYRVGLDLGFTGAHFEVRKGNEKVWKYHEGMGARRVGEDEHSLLYRFDKGAILDAFTRYGERAAVEVEW